MACDRTEEEESHTEPLTADADDDRLRRRRPLGSIQNSALGDSAVAMTNGGFNETRRIAGPNESKYRQNYDSFVTNTIARYLARTQTNLHPNGTLPNYSEMSPSQRVSALNSVHDLLERLSNTNDNISNAVVGARDDGGYDQHDDSVTTLGGEFSRLGNDETFESATTTSGPSVGKYCDETHGSKPALRGYNRESTGSNEQEIGISHLLDESMNLLSDEEDSRFSEGEDACCGIICKSNIPRQNDTSWNTTTSPIERARHAEDHNNNYSRSLHLAFEDGRSTRDASTTPPVFPQKHPSKRFASNSGKRGLKARQRSNHESVDAELLRGHGDGFCGDESESRMYQYFKDEESPIQRVEFDYEYDLAEDELHDFPNRQRKVDGVSFNYKNEIRGVNDRRVSNFDGEAFHGGKTDFCHGDYDHDIAGDYSDGDDQGAGRNSNFAEPSMTHQQHSQWSSFQNANANLTSTQLGDEYSPVRRGIIYAGESQPTLYMQKSQAKGQGKSNLKEDTDENDPIQTVRNLCRRAKSLEQQGLDSLEEVAPIDVRVRDGMHFRLDPLLCHNDISRINKSLDPSLSEPQSFKDPISIFPSRMSTRFNAAVDFMIEKERHAQSSTAYNVESEREHSCAILLSMTIQQILCVTSKFLIQANQSTRNYQLSRTTPYQLTPALDLPSKDGDSLAGGTLIIVREKQDIEQWEVALREYTSLSVLNHVAVQANVRKLGAFAAKCAGYDVVLSTYDAVKTKEVTVPVDSFGYAALGASEQSNNNDGWLASRVSGTSAKCLQLSVLHRLCWCRIIFLDVLGRKGYLTKSGTKRDQAAIAFNSKSRFVLFEHAGDNSSKAETKFFEDRKQLRSIFSPLHLPERMKLDSFLNAYVLDLKRAGRTSSSSEERES